MNIDIAFAARLKLLDRHEKLLIQLLVELIKDKRPLCRNQRRVGVGVFLVAYVHNRLALLVNLVKHMHKILLIVAVVSVALCNGRIHQIECALDYVVHFRNWDFILIHPKNTAVHKRGYLAYILVCEFHKCAECRFFNRDYNLFYIIFLFSSVLFYNVYHNTMPLSHFRFRTRETRSVCASAVCNVKLFIIISPYLVSVNRRYPNISFLSDFIFFSIFPLDKYPQGVYIQKYPQGVYGKQ